MLLIHFHLHLFQLKKKILVYLVDLLKLSLIIDLLPLEMKLLEYEQ